MHLSPGNLTSANGTVPTIRGFIHVAAKPGAVDIAVPCTVAATLCIPRSTYDDAATKNGVYSVETHRLVLDGAEVKAVDSAGGHLCAAAPVSCKAKGAMRLLRAEAR